MQGIAGWLRLVAALMCLTLAGAASAQVAGKDFTPVTPPQPTETGNRIEVIEFFSYACPHCHTLEVPLNGWLKRKPADVEFRRVPVIFNESWVPFARLYYTLEAMGLVDKLHREVFTAIHEQKVRLQDPKVLFDWVATKGVDKQKFMDTFNSFAVQSRTQRSPDTTRRYDVEFTPAVVIDGRYLTAPSMTGTGSSVDYDRFFKVVDQLIATARKNHTAK
ncbi:MAG TPA: thiol:disulfide interchange protein DsbA/DsbL [Burkholderiales bacterium]|jgi:thiol:disulfide interchange protein DsbA|nr:thiol:disulfide interchange protein DsbA/DsbL [Burkholderiales bacterium]